MGTGSHEADDECNAPFFANKEQGCTNASALCREK